MDNNFDRKKALEKQNERVSQRITDIQKSVVKQNNREFKVKVAKKVTSVALAPTVKTVKTVKKATVMGVKKGARLGKEALKNEIEGYRELEQLRDKAISDPKRRMKDVADVYREVRQNIRNRPELKKLKQEKKLDKKDYKQTKKEVKYNKDELRKRLKIVKAQADSSERKGVKNRAKIEKKYNDINSRQTLKVSKDKDKTTKQTYKDLKSNKLMVDKSKDKKRFTRKLMMAKKLSESDNLAENVLKETSKIY